MICLVVVVDRLLYHFFSPDTNNVILKRKEFIENCIYWDVDVLVIDFKKWYSNYDKQSIPSLAILKSKIPTIRIIDDITVRENSILKESISILCDNFDLTKIDSNSIVNGIVYNVLSSKELQVKDNKIPFNVNFIEYKNCNIRKIYPKWPKCILQFNKTTWMNILANYMGVSKNAIDVQHVTNKLQINLQ